MRFLLKCIFWLGGVFLIMPGLVHKSPEPVRQNRQQPAVSSGNNQASTHAPDPVKQLLQAGKTVQDIIDFCNHNPALCAAGKSALLQAAQQTDGESPVFTKNNPDNPIKSGAAQPASATSSVPLPAQRPPR
ncbi:hypothetical protein [Pseudochrobactrum sp. HB0163]|uniref:hypothetical protein n=1 Tax=Pseudochrobactrum sp. HB0163 TaxID=3450708 RepID=UPI003F6DCC6F